MITLAVAQMMYFFYLQTPFTHGEDGIQAVPRGQLFGMLDLSQPLAMYYTVLAIFIAAFLLIYRIIHSPFGQVLKAIRENEPRAISLGYDADRYKLLAFVLSATLAGLAGATKAIVFQLASLTDVHWTMSGEVVLMTLLGGMGTIFGPVVGAFVIIGLENYLAGFGEWVTVITGAIFVVCVLAFRRGIVGEIAAWWARRARLACRGMLAWLSCSRVAAGAGAQQLEAVGACRDGVPNGAYELFQADGRLARGRRIRAGQEDRDLHLLDRRRGAHRRHTLQRRRAQRHDRAVVYDSRQRARAAAEVGSALCRWQAARDQALLVPERQAELEARYERGSLGAKAWTEAGLPLADADARAGWPRRSSQRTRPVYATLDALVRDHRPHCDLRAPGRSIAS